MERGRRHSLELLRAVSNPVNLELLAHLTTGPSYPRELARLLGRSESDIARRLKKLEKLGLIESAWARVMGKTIRLYRSRVRDIRVDLSSGKVVLVYPEGGEVVLPTMTCGDSPAVPRHFVNRSRELEILQNAQGLVYVWGPPGIGKTSLVAKAYEGNMVWHSLSEWDGLPLLARKIACYLALRGSPRLLHLLRMRDLDPEVFADEARPLLASHKATLVVDDFHRSGNGVRRFVNALARDTRGFRLVVISRGPPRGKFATSATIVRVGPLGREDTLALVERLGGRVEGAYESTKGHPLLAELYSRMGESEYWGHAFDYIIEEFISSLPERDREVFYILASLPDDVTEEFLTKMTGRRVRMSLHKLVNTGLVYRRGQYYGVPEFVRSVLGEWSIRREILRRAAEVLARTGGWEARLKAMKYALMAGDTMIPSRIVEWRVKSGDHTYLFYFDEYKDLVKRLEASNPPLRYRPCILLELATLERLEANAAKAMEFCSRAANLARAVGDRMCYARSQCLASYLLVHLGRFDEAKEKGETCRTISEELDDPIGLYIAYANLAYVHDQTGDVEGTIYYTKREAEAAARINDVIYTIMGWFHVGVALNEADRTGEALSWLYQAMEAAKAAGLVYAETMINSILADAYSKIGDREKARHHADEAYRLVQIFPRNLRLIIYTHIGRAYNRIHAYDETLKLCHDVAEQYFELAFECAVANAAHNRVDEAKTFIEQACRAARRQEARIAWMLNSLATYHSHLEWLDDYIREVC